MLENDLHNVNSSFAGPIYGVALSRACIFVTGSESLAVKHLNFGLFFLLDLVVEEIDSHALQIKDPEFRATNFLDTPLTVETIRLHSCLNRDGLSSVKHLLCCGDLYKMSGGAGLENLVDQIISVITNDGRNILGILKGFDQATNIILDESHERVYSTKEGVQQLVLGLYIIRGDNISIVGEVDEELDASLDLLKLRAHPLKPVIH
ncbi:hypothetical protein POM88_052931 [Heracleum sosnowskyi]|uniref:U6 snRNA-associated Sm-like protein LSm8 n=1 Tax=Heracleum sosnowskyi TaxID=360622 RepID=A0AAD8GR78_9APIA|nr:hypothetical protein POM88_052931 [Heracleum sosnowskyi]